MHIKHAIKQLFIFLTIRTHFVCTCVITFIITILTVRTTFARSQNIPHTFLEFIYPRVIWRLCANNKQATSCNDGVCALIWLGLCFLQACLKFEQQNISPPVLSLNPAESTNFSRDSVSLMPRLGPKSESFVWSVSLLWESIVLSGNKMKFLQKKWLRLGKGLPKQERENKASVACRARRSRCSDRLPRRNPDLGGRHEIGPGLGLFPRPCNASGLKSWNGVLLLKRTERLN